MIQKRLLSLFLLLALTGCALFQSAVPPAPKTPTQAMYEVQEEYNAAVRTMVDLRKSGTITDALYPKVEEQRKKAHDILDAGWIALGKGQYQTAQDQAALLRNTLTALRALFPTGGK